MAEGRWGINVKVLVAYSRLNKSIQYCEETILVTITRNRNRNAQCLLNCRMGLLTTETSQGFCESR